MFDRNASELTRLNIRLQHMSEDKEALSASQEKTAEYEEISNEETVLLELIRKKLKHYS